MFPAASPTWGHSRGDGGGGDPAAALGGHGRHLDGVGGEGRQPRDLVLQGVVGQGAGQAGLVPAIHLPGDLVPCKAHHPQVRGTQLSCQGPVLQQPREFLRVLVGGGGSSFLVPFLVVAFINRKKPSLK